MSGLTCQKQLGAATAKDPSLVASLVCHLSGLRQFPSRHCRTYRTLLALRSRTLRHKPGGALRARAMYRKSTGRRDRLSIDLGTESMPELEPGTKRRASVMRAPPWSAVLWTLGPAGGRSCCCRCASALLNLCGALRYLMDNWQL